MSGRSTRHADSFLIPRHTIDLPTGRWKRLTPRKESPRKSFTFALALLSALISAAHAAPNDGIVGAYARVVVGRSNFGLPNTPPRVGWDDHGEAVKVVGGYRFDDGLGIELGCAALGAFSEKFLVGSNRIQQDGKTARGAVCSVLRLSECLWPNRWPCMDAWGCRLARSAARTFCRKATT